MEVIKM